MTKTTAQVQDPDGKDVTIEITWEYEKNPCDKAMPHYHGEDDGWMPMNVELE